MSDGAPQGLALLTPGPAPSADYYFRTRLEGRGLRHLWVDTRALAPCALAPGALDGLLAVVVRHAPRPWLERLEQDAPRLGGVVFFLDDDLPGAAFDPWLPRRYALRTTLRFLSIRRRLAGLCAQVWAATPALAQRYPEARALVLPPLPLGAPARPRPDGPLTIFYHGTASHGREKRWLVDIVTRVQAACPDSVFEISGGEDVRALYAGIPRVRLLPPLPWPEFQARLERGPLDIGLAPLLESPFNGARSHTKFLEITRSGAVGVYSRRGPYAAVVEHGQTGLLADDSPAQWVDAVLRLAGDPALRQGLAQRAGDWCASHPAEWPWERAA